MKMHFYSLLKRIFHILYFCFLLYVTLLSPSLFLLYQLLLYNPMIKNQGSSINKQNKFAFLKENEVLKLKIIVIVPTLVHWECVTVHAVCI